MTKGQKSIKAFHREAAGTSHSRRARRAGKIPAIVYGHGKEPRKILLDEIEWKKISSDAQLVEIQIEGGETLNALIKDTQIGIISRKPIHIDFLEVDMTEIISAIVPLHSQGIPAGTAQGGILDQVLHEIEIACTPANLPEFIIADVSALTVGASLHVSGIAFPEGVTPAGDASLVAFHVYIPRAEEPSAAAVEAADAKAADAKKPDAKAGDAKAGDAKAGDAKKPDAKK